MIEVLEQLLVPGGLLSIFALWWTTSHTKKDDVKTEVTAQRESESKQIVAASGVEERWEKIFDKATADFDRKMDGMQRQLTKAQDDIERLERRERSHYDYHYVLRYQVKDLGAEPEGWPAEIDPGH